VRGGMRCGSFLKFLGLAQVSLHEAVLNGQLRVVKSTIKRLVQHHETEMLNATDEAGRTALALAIKIMREDVAELLIACPCVDVAARDPRTGQTPLHFAAQRQLSSTVLKLYYREEVDVNAQDKAGMTPLMIVCNLGHNDMAVLLLDILHVSVDVVDGGGWTALFYAVHAGESGLAAMLLERGADLYHEDSKGMRVADWAEELGFGELCAWLEDYRPSVIH
jgi:hypothetical protein